MLALICVCVHSIRVDVGADVLTCVKKRDRDWSCAFVCLCVCVCVCMHVSRRHVVVKVCLREGVWCECFCLTVNRGGTFKVEPVCLLQVKYWSTWPALLSSVTTCRTNRHGLITHCGENNRDWNACLMDPEVSFIYLLFSAGGFILYGGLVLKVAAFEWQCVSGALIQVVSVKSQPLYWQPLLLVFYFYLQVTLISS